MRSESLCTQSGRSRGKGISRADEMLGYEFGKLVDELAKAERSGIGFVLPRDEWMAVVC
jgi:hypothetical protein